MKWFNQFFLTLTRGQKRIILFGIDFSIFVTAIWIAYLLRIGIPGQFLFEDIFPLSVFAGLAGVLILWMLRFYESLIRSFDFRTVNSLISGIAILTLALYSFSYLSPDTFVPRSVPVIFALVAFLMVGTSRIIARWYYQFLKGMNPEKQEVLIYGAGDAGMQLAATLSGSRDFSVVCFIDDDPTLQGKFVRGRKVYAPENLAAVTSAYKNPKIIISIAKLSTRQKRAILAKLRPLNVEIDILPAISDIVAGRVSIDRIRELKIEDLLSRDNVPPIHEIFEDPLKDSVVMITGAGGSIGSEIAQQILPNLPAKLILIDNSEYALYRLEEELAPQLEAMVQVPDVIFRIADITNQQDMEALFETHHPQILFNAAAYKHVPLAEKNAIPTVRTNVFGIEVLTDLSKKFGIGRFIQISTDKAVRPANVMGASKRLAEMVIQNAAKDSGKTIFSMVRFGNVLGSSGSVVPKFQKQIEQGGPVTVTHPEVTRYFMTIEEAAQLVIQAGFMAEGGEIYLLDMGEPVKIRELAELLVQLSGKTVRSEQNPGGDIEIEFSGLRQGEKLFEELLISANATGSKHPKILKAVDEQPNAKDLKNIREAIVSSHIQANEEKLMAVLAEYIIGKMPAKPDNPLKLVK